ncbi:hypothetical protein CEXT_579071 [Caerostris extrusa]|uniref:Uncharacterized protein n=1 Tax=Caerostris extrusa TaxID=172846 RepID=A0AAV4NMF9_CAEEX|nr:hypothetical protein CEXT_579071 [Caerostris extrusa]
MNLAIVYEEPYFRHKLNLCQMTSFRKLEFTDQSQGQTFSNNVRGFTKFVIQTLISNVFNNRTEHNTCNITQHYASKKHSSPHKCYSIIPIQLFPESLSTRGSNTACPRSRQRAFMNLAIVYEEPYLLHKLNLCQITSFRKLEFTDQSQGQTFSNNVRGFTSPLPSVLLLQCEHTISSFAPFTTKGVGG